MTRVRSMDIRQLALNYYATVDKGDPEATSDLFAKDATYDRPGYDTFKGEEIREFYRNSRVIESGAHTVNMVVVEGSTAAVHGTFDGVLKDGSEAHEGFADFIQFNDEGLITTRRSFFYRAAV
ncbi:ketosteroid isomerase [Brevibacterium paucivorans]|uniref:Ketosteroid isomerase n=2 Tax=Brevibacterium paucivorans TaxID=170994 RepID=A0A2N6VM56_9MICO|nr:ketosteroid isomerase [Brevibacterium paucivorans]